MMQGNIPHSMMYDKAITGLLRNCGEYTPVIVSHSESPDDKAEFVTALKHRMDMEGRQYHQVTFDNVLRLNDLSQLDQDGRYVFIPVSGRQAELNRLTGAISEFREKSSQSDPVRIFGYPEWITFRGETLVNMHKLNTVVFSRFILFPTIRLCAGLMKVSSAGMESRWPTMFRVRVHSVMIQDCS